MDTPTASLALMSLISMCGNSSTTSDEPTSTGYSCRDYQIILNVEVIVAEECTTDSQGSQVLTGTGSDCETDNLIVNSSYDSWYFYEMYDEAIAEGCEIEFDTTGECDSSLEPTCDWGTCIWN